MEIKRYATLNDGEINSNIKIKKQISIKSKFPTITSSAAAAAASTTTTLTRTGRRKKKYYFQK